MAWEKITLGKRVDKSEDAATIAAAERDPYAPYRKFDPQEDDGGFNRETPVETTGNADMSESYSTNNVGFEQGTQAIHPNENGRGPRRMNSNQAAGINPYNISGS